MKNYGYLLGLFFIIFSFCKSSYKSPPIVKNGWIDLSHWDFEANGEVKLDGDWGFYWNKLITSEKLKVSIEQPVQFITVPSYWNGITVDSIKIYSHGLATYHAKVVIPMLLKNNFSLKLMDFNSSYRLFVNGKEIAKNGNVNEQLEKSWPQFLPLIVNCSSDSDTLDIVIHVANNFTHQGGMWQSMIIGKTNTIVKNQEIKFIVTAIMIGVFLILGLYHFSIFLLRRSEKVFLWLGMCCISMIIRTALTDDRLFYHIFPLFPLKIGHKIEYLDLFLMNYSFCAFLFYLTSNMPKSVLKSIGYVSLLFSAITLFTPTYIYSSLLYAVQAYILVSLVLIYYFLIKEMSIKRIDLIILSVGTVVGIIATINDILFAAQVIHTFYVSMYFFTLFLFLQSFVLALNYSNTFNTIQLLSKSLKEANTNLEQKVILRTRDLELRSRELEIEKKKSDELLLNILPVETAQELKLTGACKAKSFSRVTVMFTDFKDFTKVSEKVSPEVLVQEIHYCFSAFDNIIHKYPIEKIKTIGDAYLCAGGLPESNVTNATDIISCAIEIMAFMQLRKIEKEAKGEIAFEIRIGIHTGPVVAGIVGIKKYAYDIWGDTVNLAARIEQNSEAGRINISGATYDLIKHKYKCEYRGKIFAKNKGELDMYFLDREYGAIYLQ